MIGAITADHESPRELRAADPAGRGTDRRSQAEPGNEKKVSQDPAIHDNTAQPLTLTLSPEAGRVPRDGGLLGAPPVFEQFLRRPAYVHTVPADRMYSGIPP